MTVRAWLVATVLACPFVTGCFRVAVADPTLRDGRREVIWNDSFFFGLAGETELDVRRHCAGPAARVETGETLLTLGVTVITLGVYTPRRTTIVCSEAVASVAPVAPVRSTP